MRPSFLFAPGAGAPSSHPWMQRWKQRLTQIGDVEAFDYDYMREGQKRPDRLPGKSMGGRIGCHVALEEKVNGVVCLGYPLCSGGDRSKLRDQVLRDLGTPILFVQGTCDPLCPLDLLETVRGEMNAPNFLHLVEGGDHSLLVRKKDLANETQDNVDQRIAKALSDFVARNST